MFSVSNKQLPGTITYDCKTATASTSQKFIFWIVQRINMTDRLTKKMSVIWPVGRKVDCYIHAKCYLQGLSVPRAIHLPAVHLPYLACKVITLYDYINQLSLSKGGNFIYPMMHRFILYYQASERTWCYQFNRDVTVEHQWKATCFSDETWFFLNHMKLSVPLLYRSIYDFRFTIRNISLVKSKRVFWPPFIS